MGKTKSIVTLLLVVFVIVGMGYMAVFGLGEQKIGSAEEIKLGLDLAQGNSITYQAEKHNPLVKVMDEMAQKIQKRAEAYGIEAKVYKESANRISIEVPDTRKANLVLGELGKKGSLEFITAGGTKDDVGQAVLSSSDVKSAEAKKISDSGTGKKEYAIVLTLTDEGKEAFKEATAANIGKKIAVMYDEKQVSSSTINETFSGNQLTIYGMESFDSARELASLIDIGPLSMELEQIRSGTVSAGLGTQALRTILIAAAIAFIIIMVVMTVIYLLPGLSASVALLLHAALVLLVVYAFDITLTLPGIAAIIISFGLVINSDVVVFQRMKQEIAAGKSVKSAISAGYQKSFPAILDTNIILLIAAAVLWFAGTGPLREFGLMLVITIILSMFISLIATKYIIQAVYDLGCNREKWYGMQKERKAKTFIEKKNICLMISGVVILIALAAIAVNAVSGKGVLNDSLEFAEGTSTSVALKDDIPMEKLEAQAAPVITKAIKSHDFQIQKTEFNHKDQITNGLVIKTQELDSAKQEKLNNAIAASFGIDETDIESKDISMVSSKMLQNIMVSVAIAVVCILIYIFYRFKDIRFVIAALSTLLLDILVILLLYTVFHISAGNAFMVCVLIMAGYSLNSTIVMFDRIRENLEGTKTKENLDETVDLSINQTFERNLMAAFFGFITALSFCVFGASSVKGLAAVLMISVLWGYYTATYLTGTIWYLTRRMKRE